MLSPVKNRVDVRVTKGGITESMRRNSKLSVISSTKQGRKRGKISTGTGLDVIYFGDLSGNVYGFCLTQIFKRYGVQPVMRAEYKKEGYTPLKHAMLEGNGVFSTQQELMKLLNARITERKT